MKIVNPRCIFQISQGKFHLDEYNALEASGSLVHQGSPYVTTIVKRLKIIPAGEGGNRGPISSVGPAAWFSGPEALVRPKLQG